MVGKRGFSAGKGADEGDSTLAARVSSRELYKRFKRVFKMRQGQGFSMLGWYYNCRAV